MKETDWHERHWIGMKGTGFKQKTQIFNKNITKHLHDRHFIRTFAHAFKT